MRRSKEPWSSLSSLSSSMCGNVVCCPSQAHTTRGQRQELLLAFAHTPHMDGSWSDVLARGVAVADRFVTIISFSLMFLFCCSFVFCGIKFVFPAVRHIMNKMSDVGLAINISICFGNYLNFNLCLQCFYVK